MWNIIVQVICFDIFATFTTFICMSEYSQKSRWFLLHALSNHYIMTNLYSDMIFCLKDPVICSNTDWSDNSKNAFLMCTVVHLYHCLFFKLTFDDVLHHGMMLFICGPLAYHTNKITATASLFFLSGLPGLIDYTLLWVFKCLEFNHNVRKYIYLVVNLLLRSPGCLLFSYINILTFSYEKFILSLILYWNAQYYLNQAYKSYYNIFNI